MTRISLLVLLAACASPAAAPQTPPKWIADTSSYGQNTSQSTAIADRYRGVAEKILAAAHPDRSAYQHLADLTDTVGHRLAGSPELDRAVQWGVAAMKAEGLANVHTEKVMVPHWARGVEEAAIVTPHEHPIRVLGLGGSGGTAKGGVTAPLGGVHDFKELEAQKTGSRARSSCTTSRCPRSIRSRRRTRPVTARPSAIGSAARVKQRSAARSRC